MTMIGDEKVSSEALQQMRESEYNHEVTRWAAYQNHALDSTNCGHLQFLAVGPGNTCKEAPKRFPADTTSGMGWRYLFVGWMNLETGDIDPCTQENPCFQQGCPNCKTFPSGSGG